jgi:hypothetical protein
MKRMIATAAACSVSLFGFTAVAGAAGNPPNPNPAAIAATGQAEVCTTVLTHNPNVGGVAPGAPAPFPANPTNIFDGGQVGQVFGC